MYEGQTEAHGMMDNSLIIFLFGAAVGASVALLYAPMSGNKSRAKIMKKANKVKDTAGKWKDQAVETAGEWKEKAMTSAQETLENAAETLQSASDSINPNPTIPGVRA